MATARKYLLIKASAPGKTIAQKAMPKTAADTHTHRGQIHAHTHSDTQTYTHTDKG